MRQGSKHSQILSSPIMNIALTCCCCSKIFEFCHIYKELLAIHML
jgi:hypothetical protein